MKSKQTANELIIRETPGCLWIIGLFFAGVGGIFVYGALGGFTNWREVPAWQIWATLLMGSIGLAVGIWQIRRAPVSRLVINRRTKTVTWTRFSLTGKEETVYGFKEIRGFRTVEEKDMDNDPIWHFALELETGQTMTISSLASHSKEYKEKFVSEANRFLPNHRP